VPLKLEPWGTVFVVFRKPTHEMQHTLPVKTETELATVNGPWKVTFPADWGAPPSISLDALSSWSDSSDAGVKYFSGTGTYTNTVTVTSDWFKKGSHVWIDLGDVKNLAEVEVNGKQLGLVWHTPYRVDATSALKPGVNQLTIKVTNAWVNRMIGDQQAGATKYTFADVKPYRANSKLLASGLIGPVRVVAVTAQ
jgi:Glycosyl hydrolases family 2, sugar binding domain